LEGIMNRTHLTSAAVTIAICSVFASPTFAQGRHGGGRVGSAGHATARAAGARTFAPSVAGPRVGVSRSGAPYAWARGQAVPRAYGPSIIGPRGIGGPRYYAAPRFIGPGIGFGQPYYRSYYSFRPRLSLGFGLWVGYPVLYSAYGPSYYPYPYTSVYAAPYPATAYPVPAPGTVPQAQTATGGLSFDITPSDAEIRIDGQDVGRVDQFAPNEQPLTLALGRHRIDIDAPGYRPLAFDVDIVAGQVIPYQGAMQPR
jgi:hypothetical protein